jgi:hypothetical protein
MLRSFPILKRNNAHLIRKKDVLKKYCALKEFECFKNTIFFLFASKFEI